MIKEMLAGLVGLMGLLVVLLFILGVVATLAEVGGDYDSTVFKKSQRPRRRSNHDSLRDLHCDLL